MRHRKAFNHLSRKSAHRKAMLANMASSLIMHKRITTTTAKAKALRSYVEPLITKSKVDSTHSRRLVFSYLKDKNAVNELFRDISPKIAERQGGYTRILKTGNRLGDNAEMCIIELVDYNENLLAVKEKSAGKSKRRRSRRGGGSKKTTEGADQTQVQSEEKAIEETPKVEEKKEEAPKAEEAKEEKKEEVKAEKKEEAKAETPKDEKKEAKAEAPKEEPKEEKKKDKKEEEKKEDKSEDSEKK